jgi:hypothetical protein
MLPPTKMMANMSLLPPNTQFVPVTVPSEVSHRYISLTKEAASSPDAVLAAVAKAANLMKPQTALALSMR